MNKKLFLGIDIGGSAIKYGWGNHKLGMAYFDKINLDNASKTSLERTINAILKKADTEIGLNLIRAIGVGTPGTLNKMSNKIVGVNPNLADWVDLDPRQMFPDSLRNSIVIDNDANLMTLAEAYQLPGHSYVLGITIGSGIGCGFVINRQIYRGANGYAMELGHNIVKLNGAECNCGKKGCLEAYSSVNGMLNLVKNIDPDIVTFNDILLETEKSAKIKSIIDTGIKYLSLAISNLTINLDVDAVFIGGGVIEADKYPTHRLLESIYISMPDFMRNHIVIKKAEYGNRAGVMGAILMAEHGIITK